MAPPIRCFARLTGLRFTANGRLKADLHAEQKALYRWGDVVDDQTFQQPDRSVKGWEKIVTKIIRGFF